MKSAHIISSSNTISRSKEGISPEVVVVIKNCPLAHQVFRFPTEIQASVKALPVNDAFFIQMENPIIITKIGHQAEVFQRSSFVSGMCGPERFRHQQVWYVQGMVRNDSDLYAICFEVLHRLVGFRHSVFVRTLSDDTYIQSVD